MISVKELENNIDEVRFNSLERFNALVADEARSRLTALFDAPNARVMVNLTGINYIDSSGFGCFLNTMKAAKNNYGTLKLCCASPEVKSLFKSLQLHTIFDLYDTVDECIASFR